MAGQAIANYATGKPLMDNIDWADVAIATVEGAVVGGTLGAASELVIARRTVKAVITTAKVAGAVGRVTLDKKSGEDFKVVGGEGRNKKNATDVLADTAGEILGAAGGKVLGESKEGKAITGGAETKLGKEIVENATLGKITGGVSTTATAIQAVKLDKLNKQGDYAPKDKPSKKK